MRADYAFLGFFIFLNLGAYAGYRIGNRGWTDCRVKQEITFRDAKDRQVQMWAGEVNGRKMICTEVP